MVKFRRIYYGICWVFFLAIGFLRFLFNNPNPRATLATLKWVLFNLHILPHRLKHKTHIDEERKRIKEELGKCKSLFEELKPDPDDALRWLEEHSDLRGRRRWALLYFLIRARDCRLAVETGVAEGESTSYILQALADNGNGLLHSIDLPNQFYLTSTGEFHAEFNPTQHEPGCLVPPELREQWKLTLGKSSDALPKVLSDLGQIDLFLHDSEHTYEIMTFEYECAWPHIKPGGYLISDDATWNNAFNAFAERKGKGVIIQGIGFIRKPHT